MPTLIASPTDDKSKRAPASDSATNHLANVSDSSLACKMWDREVRFSFEPLLSERDDDAAASADSEQRSDYTLQDPAVVQGAGTSQQGSSRAVEASTFTATADSGDNTAGISDIQSISVSSSSSSNPVHPSPSADASIDSPTLRSSSSQPILTAPDLLPDRTATMDDYASRNVTACPLQAPCYYPDDPEARDILEGPGGVKSILDGMRNTFGKDGIMPSHHSLRIVGPMQLVKPRMLHIGRYIVAQTENRPDGPQMEMRLCKYIAQNYWPFPIIDEFTHLRVHETYRNALWKANLGKDSRDQNTKGDSGKGGDSSDSRNALLGGNMEYLTGASRNEFIFLADGHFADDADDEVADDEDSDDGSTAPVPDHMMSVIASVYGFVSPDGAHGAHDTSFAETSPSKRIRLDPAGEEMAYCSETTIGLNGRSRSRSSSHIRRNSEEY
ncbi:hypothetical protein M011DRAFT_348552 [Sporormia fimetaria CBS 119925]|uniref:Chromodomain-helicase-DNA-binding protein 1-like C-terminal domain-containing protein n=1 Tax=Sporormia fimetaria CBS 119925 TaxID=1340428 RepID=A0A6A6VH51_9PLEO|nr:hypothetical protein M011DRAFT_348552 [Sporormia fimetaria CBS 119925]